MRAMTYQGAHKVQVESARPASEVAHAIREAGFTPEAVA